MIVVERPYNYNWSKNDIRYVFNIPSPGGKTGQVKIYYAVPFSSTPVELVTLSDLVPDNDGFIYLYIQAYLDSILNFDVPLQNSTVTAAGNQAKTFFIYFREVTTSDPDPAWDESEETDHQLIVMKGGIESMKHSRNNFFINYFQTEKPFLTWLPGNRFVYLNQPVFISFLNITNTGGSDFNQVFNFVDVLGNTYSYSRPFTYNGVVFHLNAGAIQTGFPALAADLWYYEVMVTDSEDNALTAAYRFYAEYRPCYEYWDLCFHNSLGGFDSARVVGETTISINKNETEYGAGLDVNAWNSTIRGGAIQHTAINKRNIFKGDIGWQKSRNENEALQDIFLTQSIWQVNAPLWLRVLNLQKGGDLRTSKSTIFSFPIQWQTASEEAVFSPFTRNFGIGDTTNNTVDDGGDGDGGELTDLIANTDNYTFTAATTTAIEGSENPLTNDYSEAGGLKIFGGDPVVLPTSEGGSISIAENGDFIYTHPDPDFTGTDSVEYAITDDSGQTATAFIYITVEEAVDEEGTRWGLVIDTDGDETFYEETIQIQGQPDEEVTVKVTLYVNPYSGTFMFNASTVTGVDDTFDVTLDSSGLSPVITLRLEEGTDPGLSYGMQCKFTIISASGGNIGTPVDRLISKVFNP